MFCQVSGRLGVHAPRNRKHQVSGHDGVIGTHRPAGGALRRSEGLGVYPYSPYSRTREAVPAPTLGHGARPTAARHGDTHNRHQRSWTSLYSDRLWEHFMPGHRRCWTPWPCFASRRSALGPIVDTYRGSPVPVTGRTVPLQFIGLHGLLLSCMASALAHSLAMEWQA